MSKALLICPVDGKARTEAELDEHLQRCSHCAEFIEDMALAPHNRIKENVSSPDKNKKFCPNCGSEMEKMQFSIGASSEWSRYDCLHCFTTWIEENGKMQERKWKRW